MIRPTLARRLTAEAVGTGLLVAAVVGYVLLFITISGIYLWFALRAERRVGLALIAGGAVTFGGLVYVIAA